MSPDDPRHGSIAGFVAHGRASVPACEPCLTAKRRYEKLRTIRGAHKVPALGTQRRVQALRALGHSLKSICLTGGWTDKSSLSYAMSAQTVTAATAARVAAVYEQMCMTPATGPKANRMRLLAARRGWLPPLAWDDIDHDPEPTLVAPLHTDVDEAVVERVLGGEWHLSTTKAEKSAITARWIASGRSLYELAAISGWNVARYHQSSASGPIDEEAA